MTISGHCLCGAVHYSIAAQPLGARACWCRDCQRIACGSATVNVLFPMESVSFDGTLSTIQGRADSGNLVERGFCPGCGTHLYSATIEPKGAPIRIRAGTLDDPELMAPQSVIWAASAPKWAVLDPDLPTFPGAAPAPPAP